MIYTTYFAQLRNLPKNVVPIAICGRSPDWYQGLEYRKLAPKIGFFLEWKKNNDNAYYVRHFKDEVLRLLKPKQVEQELLALSGGHPIALVCYETPDKFCHRHLVSAWLNKAGIPCEEFVK